MGYGPRPDFNSEEASVYVSQVRAMRRGGVGHRVRSRPPINAYEAEQAAMVARHVERVVSGPCAPALNVAELDESTCAKCGGVLSHASARLWRELYTSQGKISLYKCQGC